MFTFLRLKLLHPPPLTYFSQQHWNQGWNYICNLPTRPFFLPLALVLVDISAPSQLLGKIKKKNQVSCNFKHRRCPLQSRLGGEVKLTTTHTSLPSPSCEAREARSRSDPHSSSTEPLGVTMSSWFTTNWFRLSGSDSHVTKRPKPEGKKHANPLKIMIGVHTAEGFKKQAAASSSSKIAFCFSFTESAHVHRC